MSIVERSIGEAAGRKVDQAELAEIFGVAPKTIWEWQAEGLPFEPRAATGAEHLFDTAKALTWLLRREVNKAAGGETQKDRLARVQADRIELEIAEKRGQLVPFAEIEPQWGRVVDAIRTELLMLPDRTELDLDEVKRDVLREVVEGVLRNLSVYDPTAEPDPEGDAPLRTSGADDGGGVGGVAALPVQPVGEAR
jgi:phage terminase Nu1 subunit (DNA packaging protein)